ncbi:MAG TPA: M23 family metallopeptidase [Desulfuromonadales bacterium]|nr:M23 family metallopeptidase [Desulfuromonadales bacterium]
MRKILFLIIFTVVIVVFAFMAATRDWQAPAITMAQSEYVGAEMVVNVSDNQALDEACYTLDGQADARACTDMGGAYSGELIIDLSSLEDGPHEVCVTASDVNLFAANRSSQCRTYTLDTVPPRGAVESATRYMQRGSSAAVYVTTSEAETNLRVIAGRREFPFISNAAGTRHFAVFAHPHDVEMEDFKPIVEIIDRAGNTRRLPIGTVTKDRSFNQDTLNVPASFIEQKSLEMLNQEGSGKEAFLQMNRDLRAESRAEISAVTSAFEAGPPVWEGPFYRNAGAPKAQFADYRTYLLEGEVIDHQTHYGLDIAGLAQMPIKAANRGTVRYADYIGIYGNCVIIDHGGHVSTLYAHLSQIDVGQGEVVEKQQVIGRSGKSGMAGGDHLHYATYVDDVPVEPTAWFDPAWLQTRINDIYADFAAAE